MIFRLPGTTFDSAEGGQTTSFHRRRFNVGGVGVRPQVGIQILCYVGSRSSDVAFFFLYIWFLLQKKICAAPRANIS